MAQTLVTKLLRAELEPELQSGEALAHIDVTGVVAQIIGVCFVSDAHVSPCNV